jgi:dTDP-3-amino-3,4,6-trideoxy-alpha-D-glucose transaminase
MHEDSVLAPQRAVPFLDLAPVHEGLKAELLAAISDLIDLGAFTNGAAVADFERAFAEHCGTRCCVGTASGLDALRLALIAAGIEPGDEVVVPAMTFVATFEAVTQAGGRPVVADVSDADDGLDPAAAAAALTGSTRFVVPVHLYGQIADMRALRSLAARHDLAIVEDACQAHGAERDGLRAGAAGTAAAFSFYPAKNLGAFGDAGAVVTDDARLARRLRVLREHGQRLKYRHEVEGYTARLDTIQALVLLRKLPLLEGWNEERRAAAAFYDAALAGVGDLRLPPVPEGSNPVWHLYVVRTQVRAPLADYLAERRIATGRHYPDPPHLTEAYAHLGYRRGEFPVAERLGDEALSLPMFPGISEAQLETVVEAISSFFDG